MGYGYRILTLLGATALCLLGCETPPPPKPPPLNFSGEYRGLVVWMMEDDDQTDSVFQAVTATFTQNEYVISSDTADTENYNPDFCLCRSKGQYRVTDRIEMTVQPDSATSALCEPCDTTRLVNGAYVLEQPAGAIRLSRVWSEDGIVFTNRLMLSRIG